MVYGSDLTYQPVEEASNELFQNPEHLLSYSGARLSKSHTSFFIKQLAGKTIICQHLYPDYLDSLGALIIELDLASFPLSSIFNPESSSRLPCFITDTNGLPIFMGELPSSLASLFPLAALSSVPAQTVLYAQNGLTYFYHRSSSTSWSYILQISTSQLQFYTPLSQIILFCILGLVCSVLLSVLIASKANQPIRRLLFEAGPSSRSPDVDAENEVDYLSKTYSYTTRQNEELSQAIQGITPLVLERPFGHLLSGRPLSEEHISSILSGIGNPFPQEATFWPWLSQSPAVLPVVLPHWSAIFCSVRSRNNCINFCLPPVPVTLSHKNFLLLPLYWSFPAIFPKPQSNSWFRHLLRRFLRGSLFPPII